MRCWARFNRAEATIFMALVICPMFLTLLMRPLISRICAIEKQPLAFGHRPSAKAYSLLEQEFLREFLDRGCQLGLDVVCHVVLFPDGLQDRGVLGLHMSQKFGLESPPLFDRQIV